MHARAVVLQKHTKHATTKTNATCDKKTAQYSRETSLQCGTSSLYFLAKKDIMDVCLGPVSTLAFLRSLTATTQPQVVQGIELTTARKRAQTHTAWWRLLLSSLQARHQRASQQAWAQEVSQQPGVPSRTERWAREPPQPQTRQPLSLPTRAPSLQARATEGWGERVSATTASVTLDKPRRRTKEAVFILEGTLHKHLHHVMMNKL